MRSLRRLAAWLDFTAAPQSKLEVFIRLGVRIFFLVLAVKTLVVAVRPLATTPPPPALRDGPGMRFGMSDELRKKIWADIAANEPGNIATGVAGFPGLPWSQEDHRCAQERFSNAALARKYGLNLTQIYLVMDEGVRNQWPGVDGKPLKATTPPLEPRRGP